MKKDPNHRCLAVVCRCVLEKWTGQRLIRVMQSLCLGCGRTEEWEQ